MSTTLRIDSFAAINIVERGELSADVAAGATSLKVMTTDGFEEGQLIYVGQPAREGIEKAAVASVDDVGTLTIDAALKLAHRRSDAVTAVLGDRIKIYRAPNVDGSVPAAESFTLLATRTIDADQPSTYYRDEGGSSAYWYCFSYFNADSEAETDRSEPIRGDDFEHYASLSAIRKEAGFERAYNLADSLVDEARRQAQSDINSALSRRYKTPFSPVPEMIRTLTVRLAAALLRWQAGVGKESDLKAVRAQIDAIAKGEDAVTGDDGNDLDTSEGVTGYFGNEPRMFSVGQRF